MDLQGLIKKTYTRQKTKNRKKKVIAQKRGLFEKEAYFNNLSVSLIHHGIQ